MKTGTKETFVVLRKIDGKDVVETVQGYALGEHFGAYWFTHKENGNWRVSEVKAVCLPRLVYTPATKTVIYLHLRRA